MKTRQLWHRLRYWKQIRQGYGLLSDLGEKKTFTVAGDKMFFTNGVDPLVRVDLTTSKAEKYAPPVPAEDTYKLTRLGPGEMKLISVKNVYVGLDSVIRPTPFNMPREGLWYFDGQVFYQKA